MNWVKAGIAAAFVAGVAIAVGTSIAHLALRLSRLRQHNDEALPVGILLLIYGAILFGGAMLMALPDIIITGAHTWPSPIDYLIAGALVVGSGFIVVGVVIELVRALMRIRAHLHSH